MSVTAPAPNVTTPAQSAKPLPQNLVLTVINKTEALLTKLTNLDTGKPLTLQVLTATPNGRATVGTGSLQANVKSPVPLKSGDVIIAKVESQGTAIRFVQSEPSAQQTNPTARPASSSASPTTTAPPVRPASTGPATQQQTPQAKPPTQIQNAPRSIGQDVARQPVAIPAIPRQTLKDAGTKTATQKANTVQGQPQSNPQTPQTASKTITPSNGPAVQRQPVTGQSQANPSQPNNLQSSTPAATAPRPNHTAQIPSGQQQTPQIPVAQSIARPAPSILLAGTQTVVTVLQTATDTKSQPAKPQTIREKFHRPGTPPAYPPPKVQAPPVNGEKIGRQLTQGENRITQLAQATGTATTESPDSWEPAKPGAVDLHLEVPLKEGKQPTSIHLNIWRDQNTGQDRPDSDNWIIQFSVESNDNAPLYIKARYQQSGVHLTVWTEDDAFVVKLRENMSDLENRMTASGLALHAANIHRGRPPTAPKSAEIILERSE